MTYDFKVSLSFLVPPIVKFCIPKKKILNGSTYLVSLVLHYLMDTEMFLGFQI